MASVTVHLMNYSDVNISLRVIFGGGPMMWIWDLHLALMA